MPNEHKFDFIASSRTYFPNLDALRFLAFWGVFTSHIFTQRPDVISNNNILDKIFTIVSFPFFEVPFFFTLSSFLITYRILEEYRITGKFFLSYFYVRRTARIWPLYFLVLGIIFLIIPLLYKLNNWQTPTLPPPAPFLFFYSNFYMINHGNEFIFALAVFWSLAVEEQFYLAWGIVLKYLKKYLAALITLLYLLSIGFSIWYLRGNEKEISNLEIHSIHILIYLTSGAFIAFICNERTNIYQKLFSASNQFYYACYILLVILYFFPIEKTEPVQFVIIKAINSILFGIIIFDQAIRKYPVIRAGRFRSINYLGKISYGLYIYHALVISFFTSLILGKEPINFNQRLLIFLPILLITIIISHISYKYFERRFIKWRT